MNTNSYFTVELLTAGTLGLHANGAECIPVTMYYWINKDPNSNRDNYDGTITSTSSVTYIPNLNSGDKIKFYRAETTALGSVENASSSWNNRFTGTAYVKLSGNLASLIGFSETLPPGAFRYFLYNYRCKDASELEFPWENVSSSYCFCRMFQNNISLTKAPKLKADNISSNCYKWMFLNCSSLVEVTCLCKTKNSNSTSSWLDGVASTGTFIKHPDATWSEGKSGIPTGWTVKNMNPQTQTIDYSKVTAAYVKGNTSLSAIYGRGNVLLWGTPVSPDYEYQYFTIECITSSFIDVINNAAPNITFYYSKNGGEWVEKTTGSQPRITLNAGDKLRFYASPSSAWAYDGLSTNSFRITTGEVIVYGNIMSLVNGTSTVNTTQSTTIPYEHEFTGFLSGSTAITDVSNLILPAVNLTKNCYQYLFQSCDSITTAPVLPATTLVDYCYYSMFRYCSSLNYIKCLANNISATECTGIWVTGVAASGTFIKDSNMSSWSTGVNGIPLNWTVQNA